MNKCLCVPKHKTKWLCSPKGSKNLLQKLKKQFWKARSETACGWEVGGHWPALDFYRGLSLFLPVSVILFPQGISSTLSKRSHPDLHAEHTRTWPTTNHRDTPVVMEPLRYFAEQKKLTWLCKSTILHFLKRLKANNNRHLSFFAQTLLQKGCCVCLGISDLGLIMWTDKDALVMIPAFVRALSHPAHTCFGIFSYAPSPDLQGSWFNL